MLKKDAAQRGESAAVSKASIQEILKHIAFKQKSLLQYVTIINTVDEREKEDCPDR